MSEKLLAVAKHFAALIKTAKKQLEAVGTCCGGNLHNDVNINFSTMDYTFAEGATENCFSQATIRCDFFRYCMCITEGHKTPPLQRVVFQLTDVVNHASVLGEWTCALMGEYRVNAPDPSAAEVIKIMIANAIKHRSYPAQAKPVKLKLDI